MKVISNTALKKAEQGPSYASVFLSNDIKNHTQCILSLKVKVSPIYNRYVGEVPVGEDNFSEPSAL